MTSKCGCEVWIQFDTEGHYDVIKYCPMHDAASQLLKACEAAKNYLGIDLRILNRPGVDLEALRPLTDLTNQLVTAIAAATGADDA